MRDASIPPSDISQITLDGLLHRYHVAGDRPGRYNGWYVVYVDGVPRGAFGSWKADITISWRAESRNRLTGTERYALQQYVASAKGERIAQQERRHEAASARGRYILRRSNPANPEQPYLIAKRIRPHSARQYGDRLVLRLVDFERRTLSLQFIGPDGEKRLLSGGRKAGGFIPVAGSMPGASRILIAEGFATAATLAEAEPTAFVIAAVDAGNLRAVATGARRQWPEVEIVVCADADGVGREKGRVAAIAAGALFAVPEFPSGATGSDFNDLAVIKSGEAE